MPVTIGKTRVVKDTEGCILHSEKSKSIYGKEERAKANTNYHDDSIESDYDIAD